MPKHTTLDRPYWRYLIKKKGKKYTRNKFHMVIASAEEGDRKQELINIYLDIFRTQA